MARYRTYKNGITGHRYKGYYIIRGNEKGFLQYGIQINLYFRQIFMIMMNVNGS